MKQLFRQAVIDKRKHRLSGVISLVQPPVFKWLTLLLLAVAVASLMFLSLGSYTRKETVSGILQPDSGLIKLSAPQAGIIAELLVEEGQRVEKNQPLLQIKSEKHGAAGFESNQSLISQYRFQLDSLQQQRVKQQSKHRVEIQALEDKHKNLLEQLLQLATQNAIFQKRMVINQQILTQISGLAGTGYISDLELKKQKDSLLLLDQQAVAIEAEKLAIDNQITQIRHQLAQLPLDQAAAIDLLDSSSAQLQGQLERIQQQRLGELRAPAAGVITGLLAKPGKSVAQQQNLLSILPADSVMQAVLYVPTSAFGFINTGQITRLRYHAFPYQRFGIYEGEIAQISNNVILPGEADMPGLIEQPSYRVVVALKYQAVNAYGRQIPLRSGMKLDADIVIEQRTLIRWLFDPVFSIQANLGGLLKDD